MMNDTIEDAVCPFCACLCDDIVVSGGDNKIREVRNACVLGVRKFMCAWGGDAGRADKPMVRGEEVEYEDAIGEAVGILRDAKLPLVYGLSNIGYCAQRIALDIARIKSGIIENSEAVCHNLFYQAIMRRCTSGGRIYFATLEQIRDRAHLIIYWGSDPIASHPRHLSKFSVYPVGLYAMKGVLDRELIVIDAVETPMKKIASMFLRVPCGEDWKVAEIMRKIVSGDVAGMRELASGLDLATISAIADKMKKTPFGVIFIGLGVLSSAVRDENDALRCVDALLSLVDTLNADGMRFVIFPMKGHFNVVGATMLLMRETGYPFSVDFHGAAANEHAAFFRPGAALNMLERGDVDAALIVGADPLSSLPKRFASALLKIPNIVIDPFKSVTARFATVFIPCAITGVEAEDIAYRMDGLPLRLKKIVECPLKSDAEILRDIHNQLI